MCKTNGVFGMAEQLRIVWEKPLKYSQKIPAKLIGAQGFYLLEKDSKVFYVGKAEEQGGFKRAKDHFRGQMDSVGRCVMEKANAKDKEQINILAGWLEQGEDTNLIGDAEKLLIWYFDPPCNKTNKGKYSGCPLILINEGAIPTFMPLKIPSPN